MLPPVRAVSNTSMVSQKQTAVVADSLGELISLPDAGMALSSAANTSVEGKLNMLLIAARERMVDSLFAVIDAVSKALDLPQEQTENNVGYALRLADTIRDLTPKQVAVVQQQLRAEGQTLPLQLIAQALHDPSGPASAQIVAYLEVVRYKDRDLATSAVVKSYGQNGGGMQSPAPSASRVASPADLHSGNLSNSGLQPAQGQDDGASLSPRTATPVEGVAGQRPMASQAETGPQPSAATLPTARDAVLSAAAESAHPAVAVMAQEVAVRAPLDPERQSPVVAAGSQPVPEELPRELRQLSAEIQEGLKVVLQIAIEVAGPDIAGIMADSERLAQAVIAQALVADVLDSQELGAAAADMGDPADMADAGVDAMPAIAQSVEEAVADVPVFLSSPDSPAAPAALSSAVLVAAARMPEVLPPGQAVPFAIAQYLPADDVVADAEDERVDRTEPVDDEEHEGGQDGGEDGRKQHPSDEGEAEHHASADAHPDGEGIAAEQAADENAEASTAQMDTPSAMLPALPMPGPSTAINHGAYDFYQRMAGWE